MSVARLLYRAMRHQCAAAARRMMPHATSRRWQVWRTAFATRRRGLTRRPGVEPRWDPRTPGQRPHLRWRSSSDAVCKDYHVAAIYCTISLVHICNYYLSHCARGTWAWHLRGVGCPARSASALTSGTGRRARCRCAAPRQRPPKQPTPPARRTWLDWYRHEAQRPCCLHAPQLIDNTAARIGSQARPYRI